MFVNIIITYQESVTFQGWLCKWRHLLSLLNCVNPEKHLVNVMHSWEPQSAAVLSFTLKTVTPPDHEWAAGSICCSSVVSLAPRPHAICPKFHLHCCLLHIVKNHFHSIFFIFCIPLLQLPKIITGSNEINLNLNLVIFNHVRPDIWQSQFIGHQAF